MDYPVVLQPLLVSKSYNQQLHLVHLPRLRDGRGGHMPQQDVSGLVGLGDLQAAVTLMLEMLEANKGDFMVI